MTPQFVNAHYDILKESIDNWLNDSKSNAQYGSGIFGGGDIRELEKIFCIIFRSRFSLAVSSGTAALHVALVSLNVKKKAKVIIYGSNWIGIGSLVKACGAIPVYANPKNIISFLDEGNEEIKQPTFLIYVRSPKDKAYFKKIYHSCRKNGIPIIEDWSALKTIDREMASAPTYGDFAVFSFGHDKWIQAGEGGIVLLNQPSYFEKIVCFSQHPISQKSHGILNNRDMLPALNYRIHPIAAKIALLQIKEFMKSKSSIGACIK
jgi:perosamine synthetase